MTSENIEYPDFRWQLRSVVETRRQRKTGKTIFRVWTYFEHGPCYIEYDDPVILAQSLFNSLKHGCLVEWKGQPEIKPANALKTFEG